VRRQKITLEEQGKLAGRKQQRRTRETDRRNECALLIQGIASGVNLPKL
jgi:hypothetical protein